MSGRAVIKFGGADLSDGQRVKRAAEMVVRSDYEEVVVVVSAMGDTTDRLVELSSQMDVCERDYAEIVSMGERTSARVFSSALKDMGRDSIYLDPSQENWPIITDPRYIGADPDLEQSRAALQENVETHLGETIPVICGFLGKDMGGNITTMGRGGSDTTALLVGNCIEADEVILVKNTDGLLTGDPDIVDRCEPIKSIDIEELFALAHGGAGVVRYEALRYKLPGQVLRIVPFSIDDLSDGGTEVRGEFSTREVLKRKRGLSAVTVVGDLTADNLDSIFTRINEGEHVEVSGISTGKRSITVFGDIDETIVQELHDMGSFKAVSHRVNVGMVEVTHPKFVDHPGWVAKITEIFSLKGINIIEVTTSKATINLYIDEGYIEEAVRAIEQIFDGGAEGLAYREENKGDIVEI